METRLLYRAPACFLAVCALLFGLGLTIYLWGVDHFTAVTVLVIGLAGLALYARTVVQAVNQ